MKPGREIRRASEQGSREGKKKEKPVIKSRWSKALARLAILGLTFMPPGSAADQGPPTEDNSHEMHQDSEDIAENEAAVKQMIPDQEMPVELVAEKVVEKAEQMSLDEIRAEVRDELVGEIEQFIQDKLSAGWKVSQGQKDRFETLEVVQGEPGHVLIEMEGQPIIDVVMTTYDDYQQHLEDKLKTAHGESDIEGRIAEELIKTTQKRDAQKGYNDLDPEALFYYIESFTDVESSEVQAGSLVDENDRNWLVRNVLSLSSMNARH